ncbi:phosphoribosylamine--glycine ligase [Lewinella marina]|uniref:Phosphoribosylamine--glycine ligase n=1 Tax=Neolewinella marina TaxID=438751 RepID=A0A2G0CF36_9BACT|nr:phosphoribosylamine--glycine ligase [Neolewinella marina]NJB85732.1 phosphoribosylamine--glycine ligase [Neolewinella marina]PHK98593.1 phosphoribosylamine--glycine ligase [Neolewinella marina]
MNVLLLGNGAREDALAWRLSESPLCSELYIAPGNAGTERRGKNLPLDLTDFSAIRQAVLDLNVKLVICGPEEPLVRGLRDYFRTDDRLKTVYFIGPSREAARLEGSKAYAKAFMEEYDIPTAGYRRFTADDREEAADYLDTRTPPIVLKADGLAAGKGVVILNDRGEAKRELSAMLDGKFGDASSTVVVEDFLDGIEFSVFVLTDGSSYRILPVAKDYKRIGVGDTGPNTGGMGSVSHPPFVDADLMRKVEQRIIQPTLHGIQARKLDYRGFIFFGLIAVDGEPYVIEYNCRMGDPETQTVMARLQSDIMSLLLETVEGDLSTAVIRMDDRQAATVVLVSGGYPGPYEKGKAISGLEDIQDSMVFHAGTRRKGKEVVTDGGRVLSVTSYGDTLAEALEKSYANARRITFEGANFRSDIGFDLETR